jgi:ABC-type glycerol-3-phosphate transport system substrate-binding protein
MVSVGGLLLPAGSLAKAPSGGQAPAFLRNQGKQEVTHWVYSSLPLDKDTLQSVPVDAPNSIEYFQWSVEEFKKAQPDIEVKLEFLPHDETWFAALDSRLLAGQPPDVVQGPVSEAARYIPLGALSPIDAFLTEEDKADLVPAVLAESNFNGSSYIWPWRLSFGGGIGINAKLWRDAGIEELLPTGETRRWEMDTALEAFKATTLDTNNDGEIDQYGVVLITDIHYQITQFMFGFGARLFNEDETAIALNSPEGLAGLEWLVALENEHKVAVPGTAVRKAAEGGQLFLERKAAAFPSQGAGITSPDIKALGDDFEYYWVPPPNVPGAEPAVMTNIHGHYVFQADESRTQAAHLWSQFLTRPDALQITLEQFGMPPARQSLWGQVTDENQKVGLRFTDIMIGFGRRASASAITFTNVPRMLEAAFSGSKTPAEALAALEEEGNAMIAEAIANESA